MAARKSNIGIWGSFPRFRHHGQRGDWEGDGESMMSPCAGDIEPVWGPFLSRGDTTNQTIFTLDCKFRPYFSHFTDLRRNGSVGEGDEKSMVTPCAGDMKPAWGPFLSSGDATIQTLFTPTANSGRIFSLSRF